MSRKKYWQGPAGVFYNPKSDEIFIIEFNCARLYDWKRNKDIAPMFEYSARGMHYKNVAVIMAKHAIRLGDL